MELPIYSHYSPVLPHNNQYFGEYFKQDTDYSMDGDCMKLKQAQEEELFSWSFNSEQDSRKVSQEEQQQEQELYEQNYNQRFEQETKKEFKNEGTNGQHMGADEIQESQYKVKIAKIGSGSDPGIEMYLEKAQLAPQGQMPCEGVQNNPQVPGHKKRKILEQIQWQSGKRAHVSPQNNQNNRDILNAGRISSAWQVDDLDIDLSGELSSSSYITSSEALLSLPVFKQEAPSPTTNGPRDPTSPPRPPWIPRQHIMMANNMNMNANNAGNCNQEQHSPNMMQQQMNNMQNCNNNQQQQQQHAMVPNQNNQAVQPMNSAMNVQSPNSVVPYHPTAGGLQDAMDGSGNARQNVMDVSNNMLLCSPHNSLEAFANCALKGTLQNENIPCHDNRFQYVLAAATSIATKCNEDTLTYLNQCQSYEIKLKKLGDLSDYRGKILKSIIRICFHERRLQFSEREQMSLWQSERPGERIVEVDVPLSYGLIHVSQPSDQHLLNTVDLYWDPVKEAGVYIKVNCISTEFTAKKHGGEKGVPFRIQVETFLPGEGPPGTTIRNPNTPPVPDKRLHAAACQIKVFKLKGADRKHKQDREKIMRRPPNERDKYQPSYECTVFTDLPNDAIISPTSSFIGQPYSPEQCGGSGIPVRPSAPSSASPPRVDANALQHLVLSNDVKLQHSLSRVNSHGSSLDLDEEGASRLPGSPGEFFEGLTGTSTAIETRTWLSRHRFAAHLATFANFCGADLLRLSREDLIQICSLADGIRLYNALRAERGPAKLNLYVRKTGESLYTAMYLRNCQASELKRKLQPIIQDMMTSGEDTSVFVAGPNNIKVILTDEVIQNLKTDSMFEVGSCEGGVLMTLVQ